MSNAASGVPGQLARDFEIEVDGQTFNFHITQDDFGKYLRELGKDPGMAANNLLVSTCVERAELRKALAVDFGGLALQLVAPIADDLIQVRQVVAKKRSSSPSN